MDFFYNTIGLQDSKTVKDVNRAIKGTFYNIIGLQGVVKLKNI